ncbi:uncharacterized protein LOC129763133 [Toxorhynchites rutilus septentrionalis]|uniref:uncharacterized protein LOC129763133 n=1 Tax=Toxorhynchites rutilus septentrionalis TaxID=329112 RepID=UPI0024790DA8|nr:uncharacterized protein LOC129763133 [Toxorhynchites rutilus septentrionalis]
MSTAGEINQLISRRTSLLASLGRAENFLAEFDSQRDQIQLHVRLERLEKLWDDLESTQDQLEEIETTDEGRKMQEKIRANFEPRLFIIKANLASKLSSLVTDTRPPQPTYTNSTLSGIKLPTITLPEFDGDYMQWLTFHDTFLALIHSNSEVPPIQKFHYLKAAVKGEAALSIESIAISSANYELAWQTLKDRYANEYLLKKRHLQALFDIQGIKRETAATLHGLVDEFDRHVKTLHQLGEPTNAWSTILEHLLCTRLPDDSLKAWEDHASKTDNPDYESLIVFLQRRTRVLESISVNHNTASTSFNTSGQSTRKLPHLRLSSYTSTTDSNNQCPACDQPHPLIKCPKFYRFSATERQQLVMSKRLCHNCLRRDHIARNCSSNFNCKHCNRRHHTLLHSANNALVASNVTDISYGLAPPETSQFRELEEIQSQTSVAATKSLPSFETSVSLQQPFENVFLLTAVVQIVDAYGQEHLARALLDSASQPNLMTDRMARILNLKRNNVNITVQGAGQLSQVIRESVFAEVRSRKEGFSCGIDFLVMDHVTADLPAHHVETTGWKIPTDLFLADPSFNKCQPIDLVLGAKHFYSFFPGAARIHLKEKLPLLIDSVFGWIVAGSDCSASPSQHSTVSSYSVVAVAASLEQSIERFWKTEELVVKDNYSIEERQCETLYQSTVTRNNDGRYMVRLPKRPDFEIMLGESKQNAFRRFELLEKKLERNPEIKKEYHEFMREYISLGHMKLVKSSDENNKHFYLPHHPVIKETSSTTKLRVVFDGSAKCSTGFSLNDSLCVGPVIQDELITLVLRFRKHQIALVADIAKMYRQILVHPDDTRFQRIYWRFSTQAPIQPYELQTVTYGLAPSSFLATRTLVQLATDEGKSYPLGGPALRNNFYMDDFIGGAETIEKAIQLRKELTELLAKGGFVLRKWSSNRLEVLQGLDKDAIGTQSALHFHPNETIKTLGISWEPENDFLRFSSHVYETDQPTTKRSILSSIAKLFDPLGLIAPIIVKAKIMMQELWLLTCEWDEPVPESMSERWRKYYKQLPRISDYQVDRYAFLPNSVIQLHTFADASESAYGACTYARSEDNKGKVKVQLLASKSRVAPLKRLSLARLELCAAVLAAHLHNCIKTAIDLDVTKSYFWSDSAVTLQWLQSPPNVWKTFVANRVSEIQHFTHGDHWNHVSGKENPADLVSRGMLVEDFLKSRLWTHGPCWLSLPPNEWPISNPPNVAENQLEMRNIVATIQTSPSVHPWFLRWSSYNRLLHVISYCIRFVNNVRAKSRTDRSPSKPNCLTLTVPELLKAKALLICLAQHDSFRAEIDSLMKNMPIPKKSSMRKMSPFLDSERVLRVGGRLNMSDLPFQAKHPAILPAFHPLTRLLAQHFHIKTLHGGGRLLLTAMREEYWPLQGRRLARSTVRNCFRCTRLNPIPLEQQIGQLPAQRIMSSRPFNVTGIDYAGPLYLKPTHRRAAPAKAYICVFICFTTKAVHLELVGDLSTQAFIGCLRRFVARRGRPSHLHSDNGKNFVGAKNQLKELFYLLQNAEEQQRISSACADENITWHLIPPRAPNFGGLWEAAVKVAKKHLFRQLGSTRISFENMCTVLTQIESQMNSRPLLPMTEEPDDLAALTPAHFLIGTSMNTLPDPDLSHLPMNKLDQYQSLQLHTQKFWKHWQREYLQELQKDTKCRGRNNQIIPGKLVILIDDLQPPIRWPLARIVSTHPGSDGITRVVSLQTARGLITRPVSKICLLPYAMETPVADSFNCISNMVLDR